MRLQNCETPHPDDEHQEHRSPASSQTKHHQHSDQQIALALERDSPELAVDDIGERVAAEYARQEVADATDYVPEVFRELRIGEIPVKRQARKQRSENQCREQDLAAERWHNAEAAMNEEYRRGFYPHHAACDQEAAQREEER